MAGLAIAVLPPPSLGVRAGVRIRSRRHFLRCMADNGPWFSVALALIAMLLWGVLLPLEVVSGVLG